MAITIRTAATGSGSYACDPCSARIASSAWRRRASTAVAAAGVALLLSSCAFLRGRAADREIVVDLPTTRTEAVRRTLETFREQGYDVRTTLTSGTNPETEPFRQGDAADAVFRAAITSSGSTSRVVFSGTYRRRQLGGLMHGDEREVRNSDDELERALWARLSNLALTLKKTRGP